MPFRGTRTHLEDILEAAGLVELFLGTMNFAEYQQDRKTQAAVERELQIIAEAAYRLGDQGEMLCPELNWSQIRGMGNFLRHEYHRVEDAIIWQTASVHVPALRAGVLRALEGLAKDEEA